MDCVFLIIIYFSIMQKTSFIWRTEPLPYITLNSRSFDICSLFRTSSLFVTNKLIQKRTDGERKYSIEGNRKKGICRTQRTARKSHPSTSTHILDCNIMLPHNEFSGNNCRKLLQTSVQPFQFLSLIVQLLWYMSHIQLFFLEGKKLV